MCGYASAVLVFTKEMLLKFSIFFIFGGGMCSFSNVPGVRGFRDVTITYPAGIILDIPLLFIHHDPDIWGSDVHEFRPDRFLEGISKASKDPGAFFPFGWVPRICIGQNFALMEAKMALCMILQRFEFELAPAYSHAPHTVITMHPMHGAHIKVRAV